MTRAEPKFTATKQDGEDPFSALMSSMARLSPASEHLISSLNSAEQYAPTQSIRRPSASSFRPLVIKTGWAARYRLVADGRRQIISLLLPGDHAGLSGVGIDGLELPVVALTHVKVVSALPINLALKAKSSAEHDGLRSALAATDVQTAQRLVDQVVRLGRQSAYERTAHLLAELHSRLMIVHLATEYEFQMPLTQECLADVLGLSIVHLNRTMQQLKHDKVLSVKFGRINLLGRDHLYDISDYHYSHAIHTDQQTVMNRI